jgi:hypothetical protein
MLLLFLTFGYLRRKRNDKRKERGQDKCEEMMESFGLKDLTKK